LANLLQGLILGLAVAVVAGAQQSKGFSHKFHLKMGLDCRTCHSAAAASGKVEDNNLPTQAACRTCHQRDMPIKAPSAVLLRRFSHQFHLKFGNVAPALRAAIDSKTYHSLPADAVRAGLVSAKSDCAACHRGLEEFDSVTHAAFPQMADCLVCHAKIDNPFSCELCHAATDPIKPASHAANFVDTHSTGKMKLDKPSCVICHGKKFNCLGCH
jgi:hypothetical protein